MIRKKLWKISRQNKIVELFDKRTEFFFDIFFLLKTLFWKNSLLRNFFFEVWKLFLLQTLIVVYFSYKICTTTLRNPILLVYIILTLVSWVDYSKRQDTTYNIKQKTQHMSRHYWDQAIGNNTQNYCNNNNNNGQKTYWLLQ